LIKPALAIQMGGYRQEQVLQLELSQLVSRKCASLAGGGDRFTGDLV
jgi:hypothetical protein